ncbi:D-glycero-beta-D-manno-heptose 1,7-bisphosphate 7-phosphatase [Parahaliea aestuarii]|uniref:D,D-heptose 1,7-bisphosphate phosphatase n=1 Tax=Parahaliea aestuarii TaxID=1852021 RepID=A0A5C8ZX44_9GAMM|nr:D-glycero-beta-D-manno-heptose 1,7-bisphosphate 7-phosphatase [Parahaliea aestuarii]TXS92334.1 D-glycero-beta-D-manno-heptose 1,7-bisphosphate 7-phosphatase [Parahaliea aestuarii]
MTLFILDRDGVINEDSDDYIRSLDDWHPVPGSIAAIAALSRAGYTVAVATNQSGLGRGYFGLDELEAIHSRLRELVAEAGGHIACIAYCPHLPDAGCDCRKPATGLLEAISRETGEALDGAFFVGDSLKDLQAAQRAGCQPLLVTTGKGQDTLARLRKEDGDSLQLSQPHAIPVYANLAAVVAAKLA